MLLGSDVQVPLVCRRHMCSSVPPLKLRRLRPVSSFQLACGCAYVWFSASQDVQAQE